MNGYDFDGQYINTLYDEQEKQLIYRALKRHLNQFCRLDVANMRLKRIIFSAPKALMTEI